MIKNMYVPDSVTCPGVTLLETLNALAMSQSDLAKRMGRPQKTINEIIKGKAIITSETALQLEKVLGISASFWNEREKNYQEYLARKKEQAALQLQLSKISKFPIKVMMKRNIIPQSVNKIEVLVELLKFFGIASTKQLDQFIGKNYFSVAYRKSKHFESDKHAMSVWLRRGEIEAHKIECSPYNKTRFCSALKEVKKISNKTNPKDFIPKLTEVCSQAGVAVVFEQELPKIRTTGATRWVSKNKALIQLSLRHKTNDSLWFTFFHEAGHILIHKKKDFFIESGIKDKFEEEANKFARDFLIKPKSYAEFISINDFSRQAILKFAHKQGVPPAIITGRLKYDEYLDWSECNNFTIRYSWGRS